MKNRCFGFLVLLGMFLLSLTFVSAIDSVSVVPTEVNVGSQITSVIDLADGTTEKNEPYNVSFYNDTAQTILITDCSFTGTTENSPDPIDIIQGCTIPSDWGASTTGVVNFSLTNLGISISTQFNISDITSSDLIINDFAFESPILLGKLSGVRWTVTKADTGKAVIGASCSGDILQSIGGELIPIAGSTGGFNPIISKYAGHALTSFLPTTINLEEGTDYVVEVRCDCRPQDECFDEDGNNLTGTFDHTKNLVGIGTSTLSVETWLTVNTITDKLNYEILDQIAIIPNVTNPNGRKRQEMEIVSSWRCDSGSDDSTDRFLIDSKTERRAIDENKTQYQGDGFLIPNLEQIEKGATECYASTEVSVLDELKNILVTYYSTSPKFNLTVNSIHPEVDFERVTRTEYTANVSFNDYDVGVKNIHVVIDTLLASFGTPADSILNFSFFYLNGSLVSGTKCFEHTHPVKFSGEEVKLVDAIECELPNINTTLDENYIFNLTLINFDERTAIATEGIEDKTGTFRFEFSSIDYSAPSPGTINFTLESLLEISDQDEVEGFYSCYIVGYKSETEIQFNHAINKTSIAYDTKSLNVPSGLDAGSIRKVHCDLGFLALGNDKDEAETTFFITHVNPGDIPKPKVEPKEPLIDRIINKFTDEDLETGKKKLNRTGIMTLLLVIALIIILCWLWFYMKRQKKKDCETYGEGWGG